MKILFFLFIPFQLLSQNLVMNPSFEKSKMCVENFGRFNQEVFFWSTPSFGTTDFFNVCNKGFVGVPINFHGMQNSFDGEKYAG
ncbi:MAG TPA: hypothetical protein EYG92_05970 [Lutibacter sp.]|nr:hypothetical protein [Lutibacter sp.]